MAQEPMSEAAQQEVIKATHEALKDLKKRRAELLSKGAAAYLVPVIAALDSQIAQEQAKID